MPVRVFFNGEEYPNRFMVTNSPSTNTEVKLVDTEKTKIKAQIRLRVNELENKIQELKTRKDELLFLQEEIERLN